MVCDGTVLSGRSRVAICNNCGSPQATIAPSAIVSAMRPSHASVTRASIGFCSRSVLSRPLLYASQLDDRKLLLRLTNQCQLRPRSRPATQQRAVLYTVPDRRRTRPHQSSPSTAPHTSRPPNPSLRPIPSTAFRTPESTGEPGLPPSHGHAWACLAMSRHAGECGVGAPKLSCSPGRPRGVPQKPAWSGTERMGVHRNALFGSCLPLLVLAPC